MNQDRYRLWLIVSFVLIGFAALIAQAVLVRELLVIFLGNEVCLGIIFSIWLVGITLGAGIAAFFTDRLKSLYPLFISALILMTIVLPCLVYFTRIIRGFFDIQTGQPIPFMPIILLSIILIIPFSIFIGLAFPLACKIYTCHVRSKTPKASESSNVVDKANKDNQSDDAIQIGWVYIYEALGSLLGGVVFTFFLVDYFNSFTIIAMASCLLLVISLILIGLVTGSIMRKALMGITLIFLMVNLGGVFVWSNPLHIYTVKERWETFRPGEELVESIDSRYENLVIGKLEDQYQLYGNGQFVSTFPDDYTYEPLAHFFLTEHPEPETVLVIGGGAEGMLTHILKHPSVKALHYVQLDPAMIDLIAKYLPERDRKLIQENADQRLVIHYSDGRYFVKNSQDKFDMVILNLPDPSTAMINRFYTVDFFREVKNILNPNGVIVTSISSVPNYLSETVGNHMGSVYDTLKSAFKFVLFTPEDPAYFFATNQPDTITFNIAELDRRFKERDIETDKFRSPEQYEYYIQTSHIPSRQKALQERKKHYLNTDLQPVSYFFNLVLWDTIMGGEGAKPGAFFRTLKELRFGWLIGVVVVLFLLRLIYAWVTPARALAHQRFNSLYAIFSVGFAGLAMELILLFAFQNIYGYIYQKIGFIIALFMLGLALGGIVSNKFIMTKTLNWAKVLAIINLVILIFALALTSVIKAIGQIGAIELPFILLIMISGVLTGLVYPVANKLYLEAEAKVGKAAGLIDSADHFGAFAGALLTGIIFIPLFGIFQTCLFIALLNLISMILLLKPTRKSEIINPKL